jgi:hypothetical protein
MDVPCTLSEELRVVLGFRNGLARLLGRVSKFIAAIASHFYRR